VQTGHSEALTARFEVPGKVLVTNRLLKLFMELFGRLLHAVAALKHALCG
jgi:hypothetical protein